MTTVTMLAQVPIETFVMLVTNVNIDARKSMVLFFNMATVMAGSCRGRGRHPAGFGGLFCLRGLPVRVA